jgi:hypothetical protein
MGIVSYIKQGDKVLIGHEGQTFTVGPDHINYEAVLTKIKEGQLKDLPALANVADAVERYARGSIEIVDGVVMYDGKEVHNVVCDRIVDLMEAGEEIDPLIMFLENLLDNPSETAINEMYLFMEANNMAITPDGHFLAYKTVRSNYRDYYSGKIDNSVGQIVEMDRQGVDPIRDRLCSHGLHFCGLSYIKNGPMRTAHIMIVKINPRDVVSIPSDYANAKGRCCRYEVVAEHEGEDRTTREAFGYVDRNHSSIAPKAADVARYKQEVPAEQRGLKSFFEGLFTWMKGGRG